MREGWVQTTLGDVAEYVNGYPFKPEELGDEGLPVIRIKQLLDPNEPVDRSAISAPDRCRLTNGDIVFSWSGTLAVRKWDRGTALLNQHLFRVIEKPGVNRDWLAIALDYALTELGEKSHGTTMKHITKQTLLPHKLSLPPLAEQRRIVDMIESVDNYIAALETRAESARTARSALLHGLLSNPGSDWVETTLGDLLSLEYGKPLKEEDRDGHGFPVFGSAGQVGFHSIPLLRQGPNIVVGRKGTAGAVTWSEQPCSVIDTAYFVRQKIDDDLRFTYLLLASADLPALAAQTGVPGLNRERAYSVRLTKPPLIEQERIVAIVGSIDLAVSSIETSICNVRNLRAALLSDLLSGNHEIPTSYDQLLGAA